MISSRLERVQLKSYIIFLMYTLKQSFRINIVNCLVDPVIELIRFSILSELHVINDIVNSLVIFFIGRNASLTFIHCNTLTVPVLTNFLSIK